MDTIHLSGSNPNMNVRGACLFRTVAFVTTVTILVIGILSYLETGGVSLGGQGVSIGFIATDAAILAIMAASILKSIFTNKPASKVEVAPPTSEEPPKLKEPKNDEELALYLIPGETWYGATAPNGQRANYSYPEHSPLIEGPEGSYGNVRGPGEKVTREELLRRFRGESPITKFFTHGAKPKCDYRDGLDKVKFQGYT